MLRLISTQRRHTSTFLSSHEKSLFTKGFVTSTTPSFTNTPLTLKNAPTQKMVQSWQDAIRTPLVRENITERWALSNLTSVQRAILSLLREQSVQNAPKLSQIESLNIMNEINDFGLSAAKKSEYVRQLLGEEPKTFSGSDAKKQIETHEGYAPPSSEFQIVLHKLREQVQSEQDFYIQARDNSGKLTAVLSIIADDLLAREPDLAPEVKEQPDPAVYKKYAERERAHPRVIVMTKDQRSALHAHRLAQRAFARSNASVQVAMFDQYGLDILEKAFTLGANVLVMDDGTFQAAVSRGYISARDLKYLVVDDMQEIASRMGGVATLFEGIMQKSTWLGPGTKRIGLSTSDSDHIESARQHFLRDGYISIVTNELNSSDVQVSLVRNAEMGEKLRALREGSIIVTSDIDEALLLQAELEHFGAEVSAVLENAEQIESKLQALSRGTVNSLIVPRDLVASFSTDKFPAQVPIYFKNYFDLNLASTLMDRNARVEAVHVLVTEDISYKSARALQDYLETIDVRVEKDVFRVFNNTFNNINVIKNFKVNDYIDARLQERAAKDAEDFPVSEMPQYIYKNHTYVLNKKAMESERAARLAALRKKAISQVSKSFRKSAPFRDFFRLNLLNDIDRAQFEFIEKTILSKEDYTVGEILEALQESGIEWSSPATLLQKSLNNLRLSIQRSSGNLQLSALRHFNALRPQERLVRHINDHVLSTIEKYQSLQNVVSQFETLLQSSKVVQLLASLPERSEEFVAWYDKLHDTDVIQLNDLADVVILMDEGVSIPSAQPERNELTAEIMRLLEEVRTAPEYAIEWEAYNRAWIEEIQKRFDVDDVVATKDPKDRMKYRQIMHKVRDQMVEEFPLIAQERELEEALVAAEFAPHFTEDY